LSIGCQRETFSTTYSHVFRVGDCDFKFDRIKTLTYRSDTLCNHISLH